MTIVHLPDVELQAPDSTPVEIGSFLDRTLLVIAVRYYG